MTNISSNAAELLVLAYDEFLRRRKVGLSIADASRFHDTVSFHRNFCKESNCDDVRYGLFELQKHGLITGGNYDNMLYQIQLTSFGITTMERFYQEIKDAKLQNIKSLALSVVDFITHHL